MITNEDLAAINIRRVIFHDVPRAVKGDASIAPVFSEVETDAKLEQKAHLRKKLTKVIGSNKAHAVQFNPATSSTVPEEVRHLTKKFRDPEEFVAASQRIAKYLFPLQVGQVSPGLLCVVDAASTSHNVIVLMKLEREAGAQLQQTKKEGKKTFSMSLFDNLVLTEGTKLFKTAMFLRTGSGDDDFRASVGDAQLNPQTSEDYAQFWMSFIGCMMVIEPRVATQRFYSTAVEFLNVFVTDSVAKAEIYDSLNSEMNSNKLKIAPKDFIVDHVPHEYQKPFSDYFHEKKVPLTAFPKDITEIKSRLLRRAYTTKKGAIITVPEGEAEELLTINANNVIVNDSVSTISK